MKLPVVTIVGKPNVGKSSLFNCLARRRIAIVDPTSGVTRDRVTTTITHEDRTFEIVDTGGMGIEDTDDLTTHVELQIDVAIHHADLIVFVVDVRDGIAPLDSHVAEKLRALPQPKILVANKVDHARMEPQVGEFFRLGLGDPHPISALEGFGRVELLDAIAEQLPPSADDDEPEAEPFMKLAIVGKRNAGKSTLVNTLAKEDRMIVSEVPGTTRDSVDVRFERDGRTFIAIDTAGIIKKGKARTSVEFYGLARAQRSIRRCDVAMLIFDAPRQITQIDKTIAEYTRAQHKPCVIVVNKWDLAGGVETEQFVRYIRAHLPSLSHAPLAFVSSTQRTNLSPTIRVALDLFEQSRVRVPTAEVNAAIEQATATRKPPRQGNREAKIYYATQVGVAPPTFALFVNYAACFTDRYIRFLENRFRDVFPFSEVPVRFVIRPSHERKKRK